MRKFNKILFVANGSNNEQPALARAGLLADASRAEQLTVMDIGEGVRGFPEPPGGGVEPVTPERVAGDGAGYMIANAPALPAEGGTRVRIEARRAIRDVIDASSSHDLVIQPAARGGLGLRCRLTAEERLLMRNCACPVWIERGEQLEPCRRILAVVELDTTVRRSTLARAVVDYAVTIAEREDAELHVLDAWQVRRELELRGRMNVAALLAELAAAHRQQLAQLLGEFAYPGVVPHVECAAPAQAIRDLLKDQAFDLVVAGNAARAGLGRLIARRSAEKLLGRIECSFLVIGERAAITAGKARAPRAPRAVKRTSRPMAGSAHA